jgi:hypothetical protein
MALVGTGPWSECLIIISLVREVQDPTTLHGTKQDPGPSKIPHRDPKSRHQNVLHMFGKLAACCRSCLVEMIFDVLLRNLIAIIQGHFHPGESVAGFIVWLRSLRQPLAFDYERLCI